MKNPVYVIFGYGGLIGSAILQALDGTVEDYRIFAFEHAQVDVTDPEAVSAVLDYVRPTVVFNCAGISGPDTCENAPGDAFCVNSLSPGLLASSCQHYKAKLVQFSSWSVFDGGHKGAYGEDVKHEPLSTYGKTKLEGERAALTNPQSLVVRTGWLYDEILIGSWIDRLESGGKAGLIADVSVSPLYSADLAQATLALLDKGAKGVFNVANAGSASLADLTRAAARHAGLDERAVCDVKCSDLDPLGLISFPRNSVMRCEKYIRKTGRTLRGWEEAINDCVVQIAQKTKD